MSKLIITIQTDNASFEDLPTIEVQFVLNGLMNRLFADGLPQTNNMYMLYDTNGNECGQCVCVDDGEREPIECPED